ncbi:class F sortase [Streptomyces sp. NPDC058145]|uniref:class F sortase n=1 Tax=Streptomyces sp. NPDC058145 TaxID=3346356 RepID=UPI0036E2FAE6
MAADPSSPDPSSPDPSTPASTEQARTVQNAGHGGRLTLWGVAIVFIAVSVFGGHRGDGDNPQAPGGTTVSAGTPAGTEQPGTEQPGTDQADRSMPRATPTRLLIPKISVDAPFTPLSLASTGQLQPPPAADTNLVGWYVDGVTPGEKGTAIIAGHVDTVTSAAVFANLYELGRGDRFTVDRADGQKAEFVVDDTETFAKDAFPSDRVYADADRPEVRLITCAGDYDHTVRDYTDNLVVFAHLV